jgi:hypothetical protein
MTSPGAKCHITVLLQNSWQALCLFTLHTRYMACGTAYSLFNHGHHVESTYAAGAGSPLVASGLVVHVGSHSLDLIVIKGTLPSCGKQQQQQQEGLW